MSFKINKIFLAFWITTILVSCGGGGGSAAPVLPTATVTIASSEVSVEVNNKVTLTWSSTLASSCSASGSWSGSKEASGTEEVTIAVAGSNSFSLSCSGSEINTGSGSVAVEGFRYFGGSVIDGYLRGATVYIDANDNFTMDSDEPSVTTDNLGSFSNLKYLNGTLVSEGGIDLDTGVNLDSLQLTNKLSGHSDIKVITPLTTLAAAMSNPGNINTIFGIDAAIDIGITDPIPSLGDSTYDNIYEKGNQLTVIVLSLQNSMNAINASTDNSKDYFASIGEEIETAYAALETPGIIDIESAAFISAVVENIVAKKASSTSDTIKENIKTVIGSVIPIIQVKSAASVTTAIQNFSFGTLQTDMQSIATDVATPETLSQYASGILNYVSTDQNVAIADLEVDITALNDAIVLDEDSSIEISPLSNDSYLRGQSISISSSSSAISGKTTLTGNIFTYTPTENFNGSDSFTYTINQGSKSDTGTVNITVTPVNDLPIITSAGSITVSENQTAVLAISVTEIDGDELTYSISGTDSSSLSVDANGVITFNTAPDYETKNAYSITYNVNDGTESVSQDLTVTIKDENDVPPTITNLAATIEIVENTTDVLTVSASDDEGGDLIYTITGDDAGSLSISASGVITFNTAPNFEAKATYAITVNVSDGVNSSSQDLTINITDVNDAPTFVDLAFEYSITEGTTALGSFSVVDEDTAEQTTTITGDDVAKFSLTNEDGDATLDLAFTTAPDYSSPGDVGGDNVYNITLTVSDGTAETAQAITITVLASDAIPVISATTLPINEFTKIVDMGITDPDGDTISYEIVNANKNYTVTSTLGNSDGSTYILNSAVTVGANEVYQVVSDIHIGSSGSLTVQAGGILIGKYVDLVTGKYNRPGFSNGVTFSNTYGENILLVSSDGSNYEESNSVFNQVIYIFAGGTFTSNGTEASRAGIRGLAIVYGSGGSQADASSLIDINYTDWSYGTLNPYYFRRSGDQLGDNANAGLKIKNSYLNFVNSVNTTTIGRSNSNAGGDVVIEGNVFHNSGGFRINAYKENTGLLRVRNNIFFGEEVSRTSTPALILISNVGNGSESQWPTHSDGLKNVWIADNAFILLSGESKAISCYSNAEYIPWGANYFGYSTNFASNVRPFIIDSNDTLSSECTYPDSLIATSPSRTWTIKPEFLIASGGRVTMDIPLDYQATKNKSHEFTVRANTNPAPVDPTFTITLELKEVVEVGNNAPTISAVSSYLVLENSTSLFSVSSQDADGDSLTYSLSGDDASLFNISEAGAVTFISAPDYESPADQGANNTYNLTISVSDGTDSASTSVAIQVQNLVETGEALIFELYGGTNLDVYLGCYGCATTSTESICNSVGNYGSSVALNSIWNSVGSYGSTVSSTSPWNSVGLNPPQVYSQNKFSNFGKFSVNSVAFPRTTLSSFTNILDKFNENGGDLSATRDFACPNS
ncbi:Ig-like domain-containing protein [Gammaproteobacteria bacterium]|nr:Ig-like domain-containing protein [Gammaproteobacteria bacterium]